MRKLLSILALCLSSVSFGAQQPVNIGTSPNDGTGDNLRASFTKLNANDAELYGKFPVTVPNGGTGVQTLSGVVKANGTGAFSAAAAADLVGLFSGTCSITVPLRGDGSCGTIPAGSVTGLAASATTDATNAANISSGTLLAARLPALTGDCTTTIGTVATTCTKTGGVAFATSATTDATNATNISSGTLGAARLPNPTASTLGGIESYAPVTHQWINTISTSGVPASSQPAATDITGLAASATTDTTNATNITSGALGTAEGGTGSAFTAFTGPAASTKTFTLPNATSTILTSNAAVTPAQGGTGLATLTAHGLVVGEGTSNVAAVAAMAADTLLQGQGTSADPAAVAVNNCGSASTALSYSTTTHTFGCQTITGSTPTTLSGTASSTNASYPIYGANGTTPVYDSAFTVSFNPGLHTIAATTFNGNATSATIASTLTSTSSTTNANYPPLLGNGTTVNYDASVLINPSTHTITATTFSGNATSATNIAGGAANDIPYQTGSGATGLTTDLTYTHSTQSLGIGSAGATSSALNITGTSGFTVTGGSTTGSGNAGGSVTVVGGSNTSFTLPGGQLTLTGGGPSFGGGSASLVGGASTSGNGGPGGAVTITGGASPTSGGTGGSVTIGTGTGATSNGSILLQVGGTTAESIANAGQATFTSAIIGGGTTFTLGTGTGACATSSTLTGGAIVGSFKCTGTAGASTQIINLPSVAHGYHCDASDATSGVVWANEIGTTATGKVAGTVTTTSDVITFACFGY